MKLRLALGIGALALLIVALAAQSGAWQQTVSGIVLAVGTDGLALFPPDADDTGALVVCTPRGDWPAQRPDQNGAVYVHVQPFTRVLDGRSWPLASASNFTRLQTGQRIKVWISEQTVASQPPQIYAVKIEITAANDAAQTECRLPNGLGV